MSNPTSVSPEERDKRLESAVTATLDSIAKKHENDLMDRVAEMIARHEQVDRSKVPEYLNRDGGQVAKTSSPTSPLYRSMPAAVRAIRSPDFDHWAREFFVGQYHNDGARTMQARAKINEIHPDYMRADLLEGAADTTGGFADGSGATLLPRPLEALIAIGRDRVAKMARFATTYTMTAQEHNVPTGAAMTGYMQVEGTSPTTTGSSFAQKPLIAHRAVAKAIVSTDMLDDAAVNVVSFITQRGGAALGVVEDAQFFKAGTGTAPNVTKLAGTAYAELSSAELKYTDVVGMYNTLGQPYRNNARWFVSADVLGFMANVRDGNGRPFYQSLMDAPMVFDDSADGGPMAGAQGTLLGRPVHDVPLTAGDIFFGDPSAAYAIGRRGGITIESSREFLFDTYKTMFLISQKIAGNNLDASAGFLASGIASATSL